MTITDWSEVYQDLHRNPELSFQETRTAGIVAERLTAMGFDVTSGVGQTGVVGVLRNGDGPVVLVRADMDALPVEEKTGLPYASTARGTDPQGTDVAVMHACGHDVHVTCLLAACEVLSADLASWSGTLLAVFQPAEELGAGAQAMLDDGFLERFGTPVVVLGQHVAPLPAGVIGLRSGPTFAVADGVRVVLHGKGAHGSRPEASVDPVVMAAVTVMRLQTIASREIAAAETVVLTVGKMTAGTAINIIPDDAELLINILLTARARPGAHQHRADRMRRGRGCRRAQGAGGRAHLVLPGRGQRRGGSGADPVGARRRVLVTGRPGCGHRQRGRRDVRHGCRCPLRLLAARRSRPGRVRRGLERGGDGGADAFDPV